VSRVYLDHNATAPLLPAAREAMARCCDGNPDSDHAEGRRAKEVIERAREQVARLVGADPGEIIFTSGGTEADNTALYGAAALPGSRPPLVSAVEHKAVLTPATDLDGRVLPVDDLGRLDLGEVERAVAEHRPALVSVMLANNEIGNLYPVEAVARIARRYSSLSHTDAVNALGKVPVNVHDLGVDLASFSAHKIGGPKGVGALYVRAGTSLPSLVRGGGQEDGQRAGTPNVPGIAGFGAAAYEMWRFLREDGSHVLGQRRDKLERGILHHVRGVRVIGDSALGGSVRGARLPNTTTLAFAGVKPVDLVHALDRLRVAASSGSACGCKNPGPSHVLKAVGCTGAVRFSLGPSTTREDVKYAVGAVREAVGELRRG
jgi:cysteine desulfurase